MADDQAYVATLVGQLRCNHAAVITNLEDDLAEHRGRMQTIVRFIGNEAIPLDVRQNLARDLHLREPDR
ncbi:hypothetical protein ABZX39_33165 [Streptomyces collinus]|uniref:hypothetical protein n=1 Tax=Streptomyces collinus TaxID=42684 RepID=UPI0033BDF42F